MEAGLAVPSSGDPKKARAVWLGQDPGENEEAEGAPFVGNTGVRISQIWGHAHVQEALPVIPRAEILVMNGAACRPITRREKEATDALMCCRPRVERELAQVRSGTGILAMGKRAFTSLTGQVKGFDDVLGFRFLLWRPTGDEGAPLDLRINPRLGGFGLDRRRLAAPWLWAAPVVHPASTFQGRSPALLGPLVQHVAHFAKAIHKGFPRSPRIIVGATARQLSELVARCKREDRPLAVDVETRPPPGKPKHYALLPGYAQLDIYGAGADFGDEMVGMSWLHPAPRDVEAAYKAALLDPKLAKAVLNGIGYDLIVYGRHGFKFGGPLIDLRDRRRAQSSTSRLALGIQFAMHEQTWPWKSLGQFDDKDEE